MNKVTMDVIEKLSQPRESQVISIYLPTHRYPSPPHIHENQTRLKNLLHKATEKISEESVTSAGLRKQLKQLEHQNDEMAFWQTALEGMAIFVDETNVFIYHLPIECEESVSVAMSHDVAPLMMVMSQNQRFHVLALAMHGSKLYEGDAYGVEQIKIDLQKSPEDALNIDEMFANSNTKRSHQGGPRGALGVTAPHGEGDSNAAGSAERLQYFRIIEQRLHGHKQFNPDLPLLIAATESEAGDFKAVTRISSTLESFLRGNYTESSAHELFAAAWPIVRKEVIGRRKEALIERLREYKGIAQASTSIKEIERAAEEGRVATLLVNFIDETNDSISDTSHGPVPIIRALANTNSDHLKRLMQAVHRQGGKIVGLNRSLMPGGVTAAALYRY